MNKTVSKSPERHTFQKENYIKRKEELNELPSEAYLGMWETQAEIDAKRIVDPQWQKNNLEYDLRSTDWILEKVRSSDSYAQNLYAAMCNMQWHNSEMWNTLKEEYWSCSWRSAGGIIADMRQEGDYIDWYCSGMGGMSGYDKDSETFEQWQARTKYVSEATVTEEIKEDLAKLGWFPIPYKD